MPGFKIENFKGKVSKVTPRLLAEGYAVLATDCEVISGDLNSFKKPLLEFTLPSPSSMLTGADRINTIFLYAPHVDSTDSPTATSTNEGYWFHQWGKDVDFVGDFIKGDPLHIIYTDSSEIEGAVTYPKYTNLSRAIDATSAQAPELHYPLGVPSPNTAPIVDDVTVGEGDAVDEVIVYYVYTFVDLDGRESAPSPPSAKHTILPGGEVSFTLFSTTDDGNSSSGYTQQIDIRKYRIYVTTTGSSGSIFLRCHSSDGEYSEIGGTISVKDDLSYRGDILETQTWLFPNKDMVGITPMPNGIMAGFKKGARTLFFSEPYVSYAYPAEYDQIMASDIVGLGLIGDSLFVGTTGMPYLISGAHPSALSVSRLDFEQACMSKRSIVNILDGLIYACPDGLMFVSPSGSKLATDAIISREQWQKYNPSTIHAYQHENKYFGFYYNVAAESYRGFIFDPNDLHFVDLSFGAIGGYRNIYDDQLYLVSEDNNIMKWNGATGIIAAEYVNDTGTIITGWDGIDYANGETVPEQITTDIAEEYTWKSKIYRTPYPVNFGAAQIIADAYPVKFSLIVEGVIKVASQSITSSRGFRLPDGYTGRDWQVVLMGTGAVSSVRIADTLSELGAL
jgi:hypothetical protein